MRLVREKRCIGEYREIEKFLWFPTTINGDTRWMETATIRQKTFVTDSYSPSYGFGYTVSKPLPTEATIHHEWKNVEWVN